MLVFDDSAILAALLRTTRRIMVTIVAVVVGAIALSVSSAIITPAVGAVAPRPGIAMQHAEPPAPVRSLRPRSAVSGSDRSLSPSRMILRVSREDPLGLAMMLARARKLEGLADAERRQEIQEAQAAKERALAKKRAAMKRREAAKSRAAEKRRVAAAKRAAAKRRAAADKERAAINSPSAAVKGRGGLVIGDSVALGAESCLVRLGFDVDAVQSRSFDAGFAALSRRPRASLPGTVVIHLGTNGPFSTSDFHAVMSHIGGDRHVTWVTIALPDRDPYGFESSLNAMIKNLVSSYDNTSVADWNRASQGMEHWFYADQIHINSQGCEGFGKVVNSATR